MHGDEQLSLEEVGELVPRDLGDWDFPGRGLYRLVPYVHVELPVLDGLVVDEHVPTVSPALYEMPFLVGQGQIRYGDDLLSVSAIVHYVQLFGRILQQSRCGLFGS